MDNQTNDKVYCNKCHKPYRTYAYVPVYKNGVMVDTVTIKDDGVPENHFCQCRQEEKK